MSGLEVVVRPVILPNIRPAAPRMLAPEDNPEQGIATLSGAGGRLIDLPYQFQRSTQRQLPQYEQERTYDVDKVYQKNDDGTINKENSVKVQRTTQNKFRDPSGNVMHLVYQRPKLDDNIETIQKDLVYNFKDIVGTIAP